MVNYLLNGRRYNIIQLTVDAWPDATIRLKDTGPSAWPPFLCGLSTSPCPLSSSPNISITSVRTSPTWGHESYPLSSNICMYVHNSITVKYNNLHKTRSGQPDEYLWKRNPPWRDAVVHPSAGQWPAKNTDNTINQKSLLRISTTKNVSGST